MPDTLTVLECEILACIPGPSSLNGAKVQDITDDIREAPVFGFEFPEDNLAAQRHLVRSCYKVMKQKLMRIADRIDPLESIRGTPANGGMGYRLSKPAWLWVKNNLPEPKS